MKKSETPNEITILFERVLTLELTISAIFDELVESKVINTKNVDKKIQKNLEILNKQVKELNSISKKMDSMNMFMSDTIGEA
jgi:hypothetical protein